MKTLQVSERLPSLNEVLSLAREESLVLQLNSGEAFLLAEIDDFDEEVQQTVQNEELMRLLDKRSEETETLTLAQVREQLELGSTPASFLTDGKNTCLR